MPASTTTRTASRRPDRTRRWLGAIATGALAFGGVALAVAPPASAAAAPGSPGALSHFDLARKDCLGTARNTTSKVWYTVADGVLSDVYYPTVDNTNVETLQYIVTDGSSFTDLQTRDTTYTVQSLDRSGLACRVTSTAKNGRYSLTTDYVTDPLRASVVMHTTLTQLQPGPALQVYVRYDGTLNGNGGGGSDNAGADNAVIDTSSGSPVPVSYDTNLSTTAANRDYAQPVFGALRADRPFLTASSGYAGTASDGLQQLDADHTLAQTYDSAPDGNVVQTAQIDVTHSPSFTLALGFGATQADSVSVAGASASRPFAATSNLYRNAWAKYDNGLNRPGGLSGVGASERAELEDTYYLAANVLKASEDKTFAGAVAAGLASPWGQAVSAGDPNNTYFGSYRETFARDLYETFTGFVADGDLATAKDTVRFLFDRQQQADGSMPRNSLPNGKLAPDSFGTQLDEVAYPILMARTVGLTTKAFYQQHIKRAADFLVAHGPSFGNERWEEQSGYSPSTISAEIAGLAAAGTIAQQDGDPAGARIYRATADDYQRHIKDWTLTTTGTLSSSPYFIRLSKNGDPNDATSYNLGNGSINADPRDVIDQGFLELTRLGILPSTDADIANSLVVVDNTISATTPSGTGFYRYGTPDAGSEDGYGDCNVDDSTDCTTQGKPWAGACGAQTNHGSGHLWPALSGERGEQDVATGQSSTAVGLLDEMANTASGVGLLPEQAWENGDLAPSPYGTDPGCASIGFTDGKAAGSASPLTWSEAQYVRLAADLKAGKVTERPVDTTARYITHTQQGIDVTVTAPATNTLVNGTVEVTGTTTPGARIDIDAVNIDIDGATTVTSGKAASDGSFAIDVVTPAGTDTLSVAATAPNGATGFAQTTVVYDVVPGTLIYGTTDPSGDDNGPGTYAYPTDSAFHAGAYDLQQFQIYDSGTDTVTFRVQTADLSPTFGSALGAQLIDVYVGNPSGGTTSTDASFPGRNYTIAPSTPWNRLIEVQGFGQRFINGTGATVGTVQIRATQATRFITFTVPKSALGGTPGSGWTFAVVLAGQDGFSPDLARAFAATPQSFSFGVCQVGGTAPICQVDPGTVAKAMDVITPTGVSQATELDRSLGPVVIQGVTLP